MENFIYTQDPIFLEILSEIANEKFSEEQLPMFDKKCKYSQMLEAHYEVDKPGFSKKNCNAVLVVCGSNLISHCFLSDCSAEVG